MPDIPPARVASVQPPWALPGARLAVRGSGLYAGGGGVPVVRVGGLPARVVMASGARLSIEVPDGLARGRHAVTVDGAEGAAGLDVGAPLVTGVHQVDSPAFGPDGTLYVTFSGTRGQRVPVSVFRVADDGEKTPFLTGIANATSMAFDARGALHVTSRLDGCVYRASATGETEVVARELGTACGIAFGSDGTMFVGDRSGTVFRIGSGSRVVPFASLPPSIAAFHLAAGPGDALYVTAPTMATSDSVYRVDRQGTVRAIGTGFGRPQGMAVDAGGALYVVDAVAGGAGLYRVQEGAPRALVLSAPALVGAAFDPRGGLVVASNDTVYRLDVALRPWRPA